MTRVTKAIAETAEQAPPGQARPGTRELIVRYGEAGALVAVMVAIAAFFSLYPATSATFPTLANLQATAGNQAVLAIVALAATVPLIAGEFDLSVGATLGLSSVFAASAMSSGAALPVAILLALAIGMVVGLVNGLIVTRTRVNSIIATLGTSIIIDGVVQWKTGGQSIVAGIPASLAAFGGETTLGIPNTVYVMAAVAAVIYYLLAHTPFGRYLHSIGSNREAARLVGLNTRRLLLWTFVLAGMLAGAAGVLEVARAGSAAPSVGDTFTLPALAAAFLSAAAIRPGRFNVGGVIVAIFFLATLNSGLNLAGAQTYVNDLVNGTALIVGVALAGFLGRKRAS